MALSSALTLVHALLCAASKDAACASPKHLAVTVRWAINWRPTRWPAILYAPSLTAASVFLPIDAVFAIAASSYLKVEHAYSCVSLPFAKVAQQVLARPALMVFLFQKTAIFVTQLADGTQSLSIMPAFLAPLPSATA